MVRILFLLIPSISFLFPAQDFDSETRISLFNVGVEATNQISIEKSHRSILFIPLFIEKKNMGFGIYANPFIKDQYNEAGFQEFDPLIDSYLINFRFRYLKPIWREVKLSFDIAYGDGNLYKWKDIIITWFELGFNYQFNYSTQLFLGYKYILNSNNNEIDFDGFYLNLIFGHSFLRR